MTPLQVAHAVSNRTVSCAGVFDGISSQSTAHEMITAAASHYLADLAAAPSTSAATVPPPTPINFRHDWVIEWNGKAVAEQRCLPNPPAHIFGDIREFAPEALRRP
eukprot:8335809-Alexandrium_andersonii.AAC.1